MKKSIFLFALSAITLASCGGTSNDITTNPTTETPIVTSAPTTETPTTAPVDQKEVVINLVNENNPGIHDKITYINYDTGDEFMAEFVKSELVASAEVGACGTVAPNHENIASTVIKLGTKKSDGLLSLTLKAGETLKSVEVTASHYYKSFSGEAGLGWSIDKGETFQINGADQTLPVVVENNAQTKQKYTISDATIAGKDKLEITCGKSGERINLYEIKLILN